jgi:hypothetical protein
MANLQLIYIYLTERITNTDNSQYNPEPLGNNNPMIDILRSVKVNNNLSKYIMQTLKLYDYDNLCEGIDDIVQQLIKYKNDHELDIYDKRGIMESVMMLFDLVVKYKKLNNNLKKYTYKPQVIEIINTYISINLLIDSLRKKIPITTLNTNISKILNDYTQFYNIIQVNTHTKHITKNNDNIEEILKLIPTIAHDKVKLQTLQNNIKQYIDEFNNIYIYILQDAYISKSSLNKQKLNAKKANENRISSLNKQKLNANKVRNSVNTLLQDKEKEKQHAKYAKNKQNLANKLLQETKEAKKETEAKKATRVIQNKLIKQFKNRIAHRIQLDNERQLQKQENNEQKRRKTNERQQTRLTKQIQTHKDKEVEEQKLKQNIANLKKVKKNKIIAIQNSFRLRALKAKANHNRQQEQYKNNKQLNNAQENREKQAIEAAKRVTAQKQANEATEKQNTEIAEIAKHTDELRKVKQLIQQRKAKAKGTQVQTVQLINVKSATTNKIIDDIINKVRKQKSKDKKSPIVFSPKSVINDIITSNYSDYNNNTDFKARVLELYSSNSI